MGEDEFVVPGRLFEIPVMRAGNVSAAGEEKRVAPAEEKCETCKARGGEQCFGRRWLLLLEQNAYEESAIAIAENPTHHVDVLVMRKADTEFRNEFSALEFWISYIAKTREQPTRRILRRNCDVAVRAD